MYLKRLELHGFKSFADKVNIEFQPGITGIVGPNGCGKSNIADAVRWVLGEQSVKSLRGSSMADVIFAGSEDRKAQNVAEVTLVFDNTDRYLGFDYNEVEITRRLYRQGNEAEYLLNREPCRLKDIVDLLMDTGLGRDSLSIISQGNISSFADSKPDERRAIFEEAAGVSKYKKRKLESIRRLERTSANLERIDDIVLELEKQLAPLKRQKEKATAYLSLKNELKEIEVSYLVNEITSVKDQYDRCTNELSSLEADILSNDNEITLKENDNQDLKEKMFKLDHEIDELQTKLMDAMNQVTQLETNKAKVDQERQLALQNASEDDLKAKAEHLREVMIDALNDYNDRVDRLKDAKSSQNELSRNQRDKQEQLSRVRDRLSNTQRDYDRNKTKRDSLKDAIENKSNMQYGIRTIIERKEQLGIIGLVSDLIEVNEGYEIAESIALGASANFVVTKDDNNAKKAISFLKENKAGRATFLPLNTMKPRTIREEHMMVLQQHKGYLGLASDFIKYDKSLGNVILNLLGNIVIADNLDHANELSKATYARYRVVTLQGDVLNIGGSMTGGSVSKQNNSLLSKKELEKVEKQIATQEKEMVTYRNTINRIDNELKEISSSLLQKQLAYARLEVVVSNKKDKLMKTRYEYESISNQKIEFDNLVSGTTENKVLEELNKAYRLRDGYTSEIASKRETRLQYVNSNADNEKELVVLRKLSREMNKKQTELSVAKTDLYNSMNQYLTRLNEEYQLTYENAKENYTREIADDAKEKVNILRHQIESLGNINLDAIEEYDQVNERYENLSSQKLDLQASQDKILKAIEEMDKIMTEKFSETFDKINIEFNHVFRSLFGGGSAKIKYSDPENILETGIDIDVQPPGKTIQNISLFSGGEKALIAISCLFAIMRVRTVPLCILDEVEAALDIANVDRFAKYLRDFCEKTQFIVVTHREGTMEECDLLYGATMQQKGVTKLVSVKLEEAKHMADAS